MTKPNLTGLRKNRYPAIPFWLVEDSDGATFLLSHIAHPEDPVQIEHDGKRWICSEHGPQVLGGTAAPMQCIHVVVVGLRLPRSVALDIVASIAAPAAKAKGNKGGKMREVADAERASAAILAAGQEKRAEIAAKHDASFVAATPVVVRQMTEEDRAKLEERRARKARAVAY